MRVLLFNPWITDFAAFDHWTRPLNLLRLASLLRQCGVETDFYDCLDRRSPDLEGVTRIPRHRLNPYGCGHYYREEIPLPDVLKQIPRKYKRYGIPFDRVENRLQEFPSPDIAVVPCMMTYWYIGAFEAIRMLRRLFPKTIVVLGGVYAALCREHAEAHSGADAVVVGEDWPGITREILTLGGWRENDSLGDRTDWIEPAYDWLMGETCYPVLTSVGCPCRCTYCATHSLWPRFIQYDWRRAADSIERIDKQYGGSDVAFFDDALLIDKERRILPLLEELLRRDVKLRFHTPNALHVRQIDLPTAQLMKRAGFTTIRLGLELTREEWQHSTGGKVRTEEYIQAMSHLRQAGFTAREVGTYLLLGLEWQSLTSVREASHTVAKAGSEIKLAMYSPVPGTPLYTEADSGFQFDPTADPLLQNNSLTPWRSRRFTYEEYQDFKREIANLNRTLRENPLK